jgi:hypothetical protein
VPASYPTCVDFWPAPADQIPPVRGHVPRRDAIPGREPGPAYLARFGYLDHGRAIRVPPHPPGISRAALTRPDDDQRDHCHINDLPVYRRILAHGYAAKHS